MRSVKAGGGAVVRTKGDEKQVLLIFRRGVWDLPKGKKEEGETIEECACREVAEETGLKKPVIDKFLVKTLHTYVRNNKLYQKETKWFSMKGKKEMLLQPEKEEGITKAEWIEITKAKEIVGYKNLNAVLEQIK